MHYVYCIQRVVHSYVYSKLMYMYTKVHITSLTRILDALVMIGIDADFVARLIAARRSASAERIDTART